jgi:hypothetical protein
MALTKVRYSMIGDPITVNIRDFGALGTGVDDTAAIQAAIDTLNTTAGGRVYVPSGEYRFTNLTINVPVEIYGAQNQVSRLYTNEASGGITYNHNQGLSLKNMGIFGSAAHTGALVTINGNINGYNSGTRIENCTFFDCNDAVVFADCGQMFISDCQFTVHRASAVFIDNTTTPDAGDGQINNCIFSGSGVNGISIYQVSAGGLKVTNNKFLGGEYHYFADLVSGVNTSILVFNGNSSEFADNTNIKFIAANPAAMPYIIITDNQISVSTGKTGIDFAPAASNRYFAIQIADNNLNGEGAWTGMKFANVSSVNIGTNVLATKGATAGTGFSFGAGCAGVTFHRQSLSNLSAFVTGAPSVAGLLDRHQPVSYGAGEGLSVTITGVATTMLAQGGITDAQFILVADGTSGGAALISLTSIGVTVVSTTISNVTFAASGGNLTGITTGGASSRVLYMVVLKTGYEL